jgi:alpha-1,6-mannosyltransferase
MIRTIKGQGFLFTFAFAAALVLCIIFTTGGLASFSDIITGKEGSFNDASFNGVSYVRFLSTLAYLCVSSAYIIWLLQKREISNDLKFTQLLKPAAPFLLMAWIAYPLSNDIYLYLQYGLMGLRGVNPYIIPSSKVSTILDPLLYWLQTSTYGPVSESFFMVSALFVRLSPIVGVYIFKVFCLLAYILNAYLIWRFLKPSPSRSKLTLAYLLNPFLLIAHIADAHVDVFLCSSIILFIICLYNRLYVTSVLAITAGFLTKTLPIIWFPMVIGFLIRRRRWRELAIATALCLAIILLLSYTVFPTLAAWKSLLNPGVSGLTARSIHHVVNLIISFITGAELIRNQAIIQQIARFTFWGFAAFYGWKLLQPWMRQKYSEARLVADLGWVTLVLLLGATPWLMPWYPSVLLPFALLAVDAPIFSLTSFVFCLTTGAVIGTGSGDTLLSFVGCLITLVPAFCILIYRQQVMLVLENTLAFSGSAALLRSSSEFISPSSRLK